MRIVVNAARGVFLSTPSARRATGYKTQVKASKVISIHALREEGDYTVFVDGLPEKLFLSTPSARRATSAPSWFRCAVPYFYPRPPRGGRRKDLCAKLCRYGISIHALREEGDFGSLTTCKQQCIFLSTPSARRATGSLPGKGRRAAYFYPRPPRGGRRPTPRALPGKVEFLSTPSARRATHCPRPQSRRSGYFYPRPPRGGRRS